MRRRALIAAGVIGVLLAGWLAWATVGRFTAARLDVLEVAPLSENDQPVLVKLRFAIVAPRSRPVTVSSITLRDDIQSQAYEDQVLNALDVPSLAPYLTGTGRPEPDAAPIIAIDPPVVPFPTGSAPRVYAVQSAALRRLAAGETADVALTLTVESLRQQKDRLIVKWIGIEVRFDDGAVLASLVAFPLVTLPPPRRGIS